MLSDLREMFRKALWWQPPWIIDAVISVLVGSWIGYFVGNAAAEYATARLAPPPIKYNVLPNDEGKAWPLSSFAEVLVIEKKLVTFDPPSLKDTAVCEYSRLTGPTYEELFLTYMSKYSMCFSLSQPREGEWKIRPNRASLEIKQKGDQWLCKCGE